MQFSVIIYEYKLENLLITQIDHVRSEIGYVWEYNWIIALLCQGKIVIKAEKIRKGTGNR